MDYSEARELLKRYKLSGGLFNDESLIEFIMYIFEKGWEQGMVDAKEMNDLGNRSLIKEQNHEH